MLHRSPHAVKRSRCSVPIPARAPRSTAPATREALPLAVHRQESASAFSLPSSTSLASVIVVETVSKEIGSDLGCFLVFFGGRLLIRGSRVRIPGGSPMCFGDLP